MTDASHVRNAIARFDQVRGVSDEEREQAFVNIKKAAAYYGVGMSESQWEELGRRPSTGRPRAARKRSARKAAATRKRRGTGHKKTAARKRGARRAAATHVANRKKKSNRKRK